MPKWALNFCKKTNFNLIYLKNFIILFYYFIAVMSSRPTTNNFLPHCTRNVIMEGNISDNIESIVSNENLKEKANHINVTSSSQFFMSLNETTCIILMVNF